MKLSKFIQPLNFKSILFNLCNLLKLLSIILIIPFAVSLIASEFNYTVILAIICTVSYLIGYVGKFIYADDLSKKDGLIVTALAYLLFSIVTAFVFLPVTNYLNGFFESISGFTTTGLSVLNPDKLPDTLLFIRAYSQWIGGAGIIILTLVILSGPGTSALKLYSSEFGKENLVGNVKNTGIIVLKIYSILTAAGFILYIISGVNFFEAILLVLSTISTGGFAPHSSSIKHYNFILIQI
ncbi:MAG: potassium transporter TrkG, partial [Ignavibacteriaceae bacterium]